MRSIEAGLDAVRERIRLAASRSNRSPDSVELVAVSKRHSVEAIREAYALGQRAFGENYVQELVEKARALSDLPDLRWHFIGHLQRNKVRDVVACPALVETVDSTRLADALAKRAAAAQRTLPVWVQVSLAGEAKKSGCASEELEPLIASVRAHPELELRGLMTVPPFGLDPEASRPWFRRLREEGARHGLEGLSMGMSADLEVAVEEGSTLVRVGTAIFGERPA